MGPKTLFLLRPLDYSTLFALVVAIIDPFKGTLF